MRKELKTWVDRLTPFLELSTIRKYYRHSDGEEVELNKIFLNQVKKKEKQKQFQRQLTLVLQKRTSRELIKLCAARHEVGTIRAIQNVKDKGGTYEITKNGNDVNIALLPKLRSTVLIYVNFGDNERKKFKDFFKDIYHYFIFAKSDKDIIELENILKTYYIKILETKALKDEIKKDSIFEEEEAISKALAKVRKLLYITDNEIWKDLPLELKIKTVKELTAQAKDKLENLNLQLNVNCTYPEILKAMREL